MVIILLSPFVPHISEEMWQMLGKKSSIFRVAWPSYDASSLTEKTVTIVVQVNGKVRSRLEVPSDISDEKLKGMVLADQKVLQHAKGKAIKDIVIVPKKLVNVVLS